ncbi:MAG TPA: phosphatidate cytidylyltransferase [Candidatus Limnocylindrales bacterium]|nr:phosphatidate cytidylyltransferase [Candidatus Limnocylindrales bacterium]
MAGLRRRRVRRGAARVREPHAPVRPLSATAPVRAGTLRQRTSTAAVLVPPLLIALLLGGPWIVAVVAIATGLAAREVFALLTSAGYPSLSWLGVAFAVALVLDAAIPTGFDASGTLLVAIGAILVAVGAFTRRDPRDGLPTWFATVFGAVYVSFLGFVLRLGDRAPGVAAGSALDRLSSQQAWILLLILAVWAYDTGAYLVGRRFGRRRFLSHISPSKTYAGLIGGIVASTAVVALMLVAVGQSASGALVLGPLISLAAQAGDLAESMLKRAAGAKDSGTLIPGHGGILDRVDSFLFAAPAALLYVIAAFR